MTEKENTPHTTGPAAETAGSAPGKKPYQPPRVVSHDALEVITGACTPAPPGKPDATTCTFFQS